MFNVVKIKKRTEEKNSLIIYITQNSSVYLSACHIVVLASLRVIFSIIQDGSVGLSASYLTSYIEGNACLSVSYHIK